MWNFWGKKNQTNHHPNHAEKRNTTRLHWAAHSGSSCVPCMLLLAIHTCSDIFLFKRIDDHNHLETNKTMGQVLETLKKLLDQGNVHHCCALFEGHSYSSPPKLPTHRKCYRVATCQKQDSSTYWSHFSIQLGQGIIQYRKQTHEIDLCYIKQDNLYRNW